jgi:hypothetical protein
MSRRPIVNCRGVCLAEAMIALAAASVVLTASIQTLDHFERRLSRQHVAAARTQDLRIGLRIIEDDVRAIVAPPAPSETPLASAGRQTVEFHANLGGLVTTLAAPVSSSQQDLPVVNGSGWPKGKRILVCDRERCAESRLAEDGRKAQLGIASPLERDFQAGSEVRVANRVRYYVKADRNGSVRLMREVDGGANPLIGELSRFQFGYFGRDGAPAPDPLRAARIRIEAAVGDERIPVSREIGVRGR